MEESSSSSRGVKVITEVYMNISTAYVYINCRSFSHLVVSLKYDFLGVSVYSNSELIQQLKLLPPCEVFFPLTFQNVKGLMVTSKFSLLGGLKVEYEKPNQVKDLCDTTIVFRVQVDLSDRQINQFPEYKSEHGRPEVGVPYNVQCSSCSNKLTKEPIVFKTVSEMPENFVEISENWFCHKSVNDVCVEQKADSLFFTLTCFLLKCLSRDYIYKKEDKLVFCCGKCDSVLSPKTKYDNADHSDCVIPCFKDKISFDLINCDSAEKSSLKYGAINALTEIINDTLAASLVCKLYLQSEVTSGEGSCLLLWVIDPYVKRSVAEESLESNHIEEMVFKQVRKVLFRVTTPDTEVASQWRRAFNMDFHHVSDSMFEEIVSLLKQNIIYSLCNVDSVPFGFKISYLPVQ